MSGVNMLPASFKAMIHTHLQTGLMAAGAGCNTGLHIMRGVG